jgi:hypothetical protein
MMKMTGSLDAVGKGAASTRDMANAIISELK